MSEITRTVVVGPNNSATIVSDSSVGPYAWSNPDNAKVSDDLYTSSLGLDAITASELLNATGFGFNIPLNVEIIGVKVEYEKLAGGAGGIEDFTVRLIKAGSPSGLSRHLGTPWPSSDAYKTHGGESDLWGNTLTPADVNASNFGVSLRAIGIGGGSNIANVDHVRMTIYYEESGSRIGRAMIDDLLPPGPLWEPEDVGDFDHLLDGMADNIEAVIIFLSTLSDIRNPKKTIILDDLEREYGVPTNALLSEATRRLRLTELIYGAVGNGTEDDLQPALRDVGFDVYVYQNDPAVDPATFLDQQFQMVAAGGNAYAGRSDAFAARTGGELLVNGDVFLTSRIFTSVAGSGFYAGTGHGAGEYEDLLITKQEYPVPTDSDDWPFVFFVGGLATRDFIELLVNGTFETGDFTGWTQNSSVIDNTNPASGTWCSKLVAVGADLTGAKTNSYDVTPFGVFTFKVKNDVTAHAAGNYKNAIEFRDNNDVLISENVFLTKTAVTSGYEQTVKTIGRAGSGADIIMPVNAEKIRIYGFGDGTPTFTAFMDDVEFFRSDKQSITNIDMATVDGTREDEFKRIILQYKPLHSWAALIVNFA